MLLRLTVSVCSMAEKLFCNLDQCAIALLQWLINYCSGNFGWGAIVLCFLYGVSNLCFLGLLVAQNRSNLIAFFV